MPRQTMVYVCGFCGIYMHENKLLVESHERNVHIAELRIKQVREILRLIAESGRLPKEDRAVWSKIITEYPLNVVAGALVYWTRNVGPRRFARDKLIDNK